MLVKKRSTYLLRTGLHELEKPVPIYGLISLEEAAFYSFFFHATAPSCA